MATKVLPCIRLPGLQTELVPALVPLAKLHPVHFPSVLNCNDEDNELGVVNLIDNLYRNLHEKVDRASTAAPTRFLGCASKLKNCLRARGVNSTE